MPEVLHPSRRLALTPKIEKNPCEDHVCGWGKECVVDKSGEPTCECISKCPPLDGDPFDQVCSNTNETFPSLCELYRERCLCKRKSRECTNKANAKVHLEYLGACKQLDPCTDELMEQFPARMADWLFQVLQHLLSIVSSNTHMTSNNTVS
ncbi:Sparc [Toxocara canis]|uniref:Sparc n=1 Tax=Toxocara canis TaxID=6265 RepID=A0A0B2UQ48_TOXCA|nr:Sparc [Toxocara canis]